jgi:16S rRNA (uracil1498-N3)-methyltransferase
MQLFYTTQIADGLAILTDEEARHATQVLRKKVGDTLQIVDGKGHWYDAIITQSDRRQCVVQLGEAQSPPHTSPVRLHIAIAPTKNIDRLEWFLEKTAEIGITDITPIICQRSERTVVKPERLQGILIAAMKQSLHAHLPMLHDAMPFTQWLKQDFGVMQRFIAHCDDHTPRIALRDAYTVGNDVCVLIGPEGDFSAAEILEAQTAHFQAVTLGKSRLRTETAGVVACHTIQLLNS